MGEMKITGSLRVPHGISLFSCLCKSSMESGEERRMFNKRNIFLLEKRKRKKRKTIPTLHASYMVMIMMMFKMNRHFVCFSLVFQLTIVIKNANVNFV